MSPRHRLLCSRRPPLLKQLSRLPPLLLLNPSLLLSPLLLLQSRWPLPPRHLPQTLSRLSKHTKGRQEDAGRTPRYATH